MSLDGEPTLDDEQDLVELMQIGEWNTIVHCKRLEICSGSCFSNNVFGIANTFFYSVGLVN
jgi:hypothetical protein